MGIAISNLNLVKSEMSMHETVDIYSSKLEVFGAYIGATDFDLRIIRCSKAQFCIRSISRRSAFYRFNEDLYVSKQIKDFALNMVANRLLNENNDKNDQAEFNKLCEHIEILDCSMYLQQMIAHQSIDGWIQLDKVKKLFPDLCSLTVEGAKLTNDLMEDILVGMDKEVMTGLQLTYFDDVDCIASDLMIKYQEEYEKHGCGMELEENELYIYKVV